MDLPPNFNEGFLSRGWRDTKSAVHSFWFWGLEVGGGALTGFFDPILAPIWAFGFFAAVWLGATAGAPFKQRNEARNLASPPDRGDLEWVGMEDGGRYYRDLLVDSGDADGVRCFDSMASQNPDVPSRNLVAGAFRWIIQEGINSGIVEVNGVPENGSKRQRITSVEDDFLAFKKSREGDAMFLMMDGVYYRDLQIKRSTIKSYVEHMREHDANLKDSPREEQR